MQIPVQDLRRVAASLQQLRGHTIVDCVLRSDLRQLKVELTDGRILVIGIELDEAGRQQHLTVDIAAPLEEFARQLDVGLDTRGD
jgi:hypothetical protein